MGVRRLIVRLRLNRSGNHSSLPFFFLFSPLVVVLMTEVPEMSSTQAGDDDDDDDVLLSLRSTFIDSCDVEMKREEFLSRQFSDFLN